MDNCSTYKIVKRRSDLGVIIFDLDCSLLYCNRAALDLLPELRETKQGPKIPSEICALCYQAKSAAGSGGAQQAGAEHTMVLQRREGLLYALRAFLIRESGEGSSATHIMVHVKERY